MRKSTVSGTYNKGNMGKEPKNAVFALFDLSDLVGNFLEKLLEKISSDKIAFSHLYDVIKV